MHLHRKDWKDAMGFFDDMDEFAELPLAEPDPDNKFEIDKNVNVETIDDYLGIPGVTYLDMRMIDDTAKWCDVGGDAKLSFMVKGFKIVPWPYIGTLDTMPVEGTYKGDSLFSIKWDADGNIVSAKPNYEESMAWLEETFPKDCKIVLICGIGGYSAQLRKLLLHYGWNSEDVYNAGAAWRYKGRCSVPVVDREGDNANADLSDIVYIAPDFEELHRL